jgi:SAM-dependent methyltransferase
MDIMDILITPADREVLCSRADVKWKHWQIEKRLALELMHAKSEERPELYGKLYGYLYNRVFPALYGKPYRSYAQRNQSADVLPMRLALLSRYVRSTSVFAEIGPGTTQLIQEVARLCAKAVAIDIVKYAGSETDRPGISRAIYDGVHLPEGWRDIDVLYSSHVLEHLHPDDAALQLRQVRRALRPGGAFILITPNRLNGPHDCSRGFTAEASAFHLREYTLSELTAMLKEAGFSSVEAIGDVRGHMFSVPRRLLVALEGLLGRVPARLRARICSAPLLRKVLNSTLVVRS